MMVKASAHGGRRSRALVLLVASSLLVLAVGGGVASAAGGTARPPKGAVAPFVEPTLPNPAFTDAATTHVFAELGFVQDATVSNAACPNAPAANAGGTVTINDTVITVPCNMTIQMPANTFTWADFVNGGPPVTLAGTPAPYPSFQVSVVGNIVSGTHIAALMFFSQQSVNAGSGYLTAINYADGSLTIDPGTGKPPIRVQLNDPKITAVGDPANGTGRYSAGQSPDPRLSVDQANPTITAGTGYPMCIPRSDPAGGADPRCPQSNRPLAPTCRNFAQAGVVAPASGELSAPTSGQKYCTQFVMPDVAKRAVTEPDAREQTPFEIGDHIIYAGTLIKNPDGSQYVSAHTVTDDIGVYTQPGTKPSYLSIPGATIGSADPVATAINGAAQEAQNRLVLEATTTDVKSPVDIYLPDIDPSSGQVRNRWVTPLAMTGENNGPAQADGVTPIGGGITTQNLGPQPQRARLRATKAPAGLLSNPTRTIRVSNRATCVPTAPTGHNFDGTTSTVAMTPIDDCLNKLALNANGLAAGEYTAPMFNFIFPENIRPGDPIVPADFWHLGFLRYGEGPNPITPAVGPLTPQPW